ncbi:phospholipase A2 [Actinophytocola oryzae]|uniref:phospholipase A2 n=1 Tax=Actinophytocola oryzae TaxID=502181 RepID=UPI001AAFC7D5|nr:phospholipase A2 [Actinophytocola oryzae]
MLAAAAFAVIASRPDPPQSRPPTGDVAKAERAIEDQLDPRSGRDPIRDLPKDFTKISGREPVHMRAPDGTVRAVHPGGGCSSPWGATRWDYSVGCKAHDLGYDLLRYAAAKGQPLSPDMRERLDDRLSQDMHAQCHYNPRGSAKACEVVADIYTAGLVVNSWHQRWGPPRNEPVGPWSIAMIVIMVLIVARAPGIARRDIRAATPKPVPRPVLNETEQAQAHSMSYLRILSLTGIVLGESLLAFAMRDDMEPAWTWPFTWLLQLVPLFFLAGGHSNLLAWRAMEGHYVTFLVSRVGWLIRPVLAFVIAWLVIPLSLEMLQAQPSAVAAFSRLIVQPLWLLGLYLLVVAVTPVMHRLHRDLPRLTPLVLTAGVVGLSFAGGAIAAHAGGVLVALLFAQLAFHYVDGTLWRVPRGVLVGIAVAAFAGLALLTTAGVQPKLQLAEPTGYAAFAPSLGGVLLIGIVQVALLALPRERGLNRLVNSAPARTLGLVRAAPMTVYLVYLSAMLVLEGLLGVAGGVGWLTEPRTIFALGLIALPTLLAFLWFERRTPEPPESSLESLPEPLRRRHWTDTLAAILGVAYGGLGVVGFAVAGLSGWSDAASVLGLPIDPMANLIHLLLGWYLVHCVHLHTCKRPGPWLVTAIACVPPMLTTVSGAGTVVHSVTMAVALVVSIACMPALTRTSTPRAVTAGR